MRRAAKGDLVCWQARSAGKAAHVVHKPVRSAAKGSLSACRHAERAGAGLAGLHADDGHAGLGVSPRGPWVRGRGQGGSPHTAAGEAACHLQSATVTWLPGLSQGQSLSLLPNACAWLLPEVTACCPHGHGSGHHSWQKGPSRASREAEKGLSSCRSRWSAWRGCCSGGIPTPLPRCLGRGSTCSSACATWSAVSSLTTRADISCPHRGAMSACLPAWQCPEEMHGCQWKAC